MGYAGHIGRVGALAITLGVGVALASAPGVAYAEPSSSSPAGDSSSTTASKSRDAASNDGAEDNEPGSGSESPSESGAESDASETDTTESDIEADTIDADFDTDTIEADTIEADSDQADSDQADSDEADTLLPADDAAEGNGDSARNSVGDAISDRRGPSRSISTQAPDLSAEPADSDDVDSAVAAAELPGESEPAPAEAVTIAAVDSIDVLPAASWTASVSTPPVPAPAATLLNVESAVASTGLQPPAEPGPDVPGQAPVMLAALAAARDELERNAQRSNANAVTPSVLSVAADPSPNVLVIGVDGTNLSRVLDDPTNVNFFELIQVGTTAPASIAGHTTISGPSWSSILTGTWGETTGVINNVFTPWTYNTWATVFNQLETFNPGIQTTSIANWDVISAISGAGSIPADTIINISQIPGDTDWLLTDDAVGDATEAAITAADSAVPNFLLSYFVGVDENGHLYGGDSPQYAAALNNFDRNLGEILQAVADWEALTGEQWTILMTTDHGHQPQKGFGHGFQSPDETSTFVVAENPDLFAVGAINLKYQIVDVTPTVVTLFGGTPAAGSDGVPLTDLSDGNVFPVNDDEALRGSLQDAIDMYGYPDIGTQLALGLRTIFATGPYIVFGLTNDLTAALQEIADRDIFLISLLARLAIAPVQFIGDLAYVATNTGAQIVAALTGVTGASIFPLWPPAPPSFPSIPEEAAVPDALLACGDAAGSSDLPWCGEPSIAV